MCIVLLAIDCFTGSSYLFIFNCKCGFLYGNFCLHIRIYIFLLLNKEKPPKPHDILSFIEMENRCYSKVSRYTTLYTIPITKMKLKRKRVKEKEEKFQ